MLRRHGPRTGPHDGSVCGEMGVMLWISVKLIGRILIRKVLLTRVCISAKGDLRERLEAVLTVVVNPSSTHAF